MTFWIPGNHGVLVPDPLVGTSGRTRLDLDQAGGAAERHVGPMAGIDWAYVLSFAASLALAGGAIYIMLFAM